MTLNEFKAWFEGFTEELIVPPTYNQWERIKKRIKDINDTPITYPVYVDRYVTPYKPYYDKWYMNNTSVGFNSLEAMNYAGKAEYAAI